MSRLSFEPLFKHLEEAGQKKSILRQDKGGKLNSVTVTKIKRNAATEDFKLETILDICEQLELPIEKVIMFNMESSS